MFWKLTKISSSFPRRHCKDGLESQFARLTSLTAVSCLHWMSGKFWTASRRLFQRSPEAKPRVRADMNWRPAEHRHEILFSIYIVCSLFSKWGRTSMLIVLRKSILYVSLLIPVVGSFVLTP